MYRVTAVQGILIIAILLRILLLLRTGGSCTRPDIDELEYRVVDLERETENLRIAVDAENGKLLSIIREYNEYAENTGADFVKAEKRQNDGIKEIKTAILKLLEKLDQAVSLAEEQIFFKITVPVEDEYERQKLFDAGVDLFKDEEFGEAACAFKKVLYIEPENEDAAAFYYSALFNENPGDEGLYGEIKKELIPLAEGGFLSAAAETAALKTLAGIFLEEGDRESAERYRAVPSVPGVPR